MRKKLKRQIKIKDEYLQLICELGYDYDGCNTVKSLKELIDELVKLANQAINNDDTTVMNISGPNVKKRNILGEEIKSNGKTKKRSNRKSLGIFSRT